MSSIDRVDGSVNQSVELSWLPIRCHLTEDELDAAVAGQLQQRAEQGFGEIPPAVLSRIARIVTKVRWGRAISESSPCSRDQAELNRAA